MSSIEYPLDCDNTRALDNIEACTTGSFTCSFSPICHRTRSQMAARVPTNSACASDSATIDFNSSNVEHDVTETLCGLISRIPQTPPPPVLHFDASSPPMMSGTFFRDEDTIIPVSLCTSPDGILFDGSSPPARSGSFFQTEDSERPSSHLCPPCVIPAGTASETLPPVQSVPPSEDDEVALFPSDLEVRDLFVEKIPSARFDFVNLSCIQCRRSFSSVSGLELHMKDLHDVTVFQNQLPVSTAPPLSKTIVGPPSELLRVGPCSGPPKCAPFAKICPAKTWAAVAAKPAISSSQPWSGRLIDVTTSIEPTPRRPSGTRPSRPFNISGQSFDHLCFDFCWKRKVLPCPRCDFTFRTVKSRDEHLVVHTLEDEFNRLHGIVSTSNHADFVLPKSPHPKSLPKKSKSLAVQKPASTSSTNQAHSSTPDSAASSLICNLCDKRGFPSKKALKYHLFRLHGQPMRKSSQQQASSSTTSPTTAVSTSPSVIRHDAKIALSFPINGNISCPETGCSASFVSKEWTCMKGL
ncbi:hypothetical protein CDAR_567141 [Caerostris darwini]|uniref:C2H2-type domain-containing protein n=1 Tax=Caerostris darwini TaxID=1538125 RepID=A0AAV4QVS6_9ARAC|nr:hypothetical protein CDAR_567141 [Caerostris darwini]